MDDLAAEEPLELRIDTRPVAVLMRTPGQDEELAAGFLVSEGVVRNSREIAGIRKDSRNPAGNVIDVFLGPEVRPDWKRLTRHVFSSSGCGLCGTATIRAVRKRFPKVGEPFCVRSPVLLALSETMSSAQVHFGRTGGLHAAALFSPAGELLCLREDVGRHNAVDKLLGRALQDGALPLTGKILLLSGRTSFEIRQKALAGGVSFVAAIGAPSGLAVDFARASGQTLVGFLRDGRFNVYAGAGRVLV